MKDLKQILEEAYEEEIRTRFPDLGHFRVEFVRSKNPKHGDLSSPFAFRLSKLVNQDPRGLVAEISAGADTRIERVHHTNFFEPVQFAPPGFANRRFRSSARHEVVRDILRQGARFGCAATPRGGKVMVEFVSANPTGPLHVGHGRQAALGDTIAALLESQGHQVTREFYYNDAGAQVHNLTLSVQARGRGIAPGDPGWPEEGYQGEYIIEIADAYLEQGSSLEDLEAIRVFAVGALRREQDEDLRAFGISFDVYTLESSLYAEGKVDEVVKALVASGRTYEREGALWLRTTEFGDDKDRVMRKSDGSYTYFVPDVAYHVTKWRRGFGRVVNVQGTDHHSTVKRVRAGLQALGLGIPGGYPDYVLHNLVRVMRGGEEVRISKRAGSYVTVRDLIEWVGRDAVRFFLVSRRPDAHFVFDVDLALSQTEDNPVYYVQYAHARVCSVFAQWGGDPASLAGAVLAPLAHPRELALMQQLAAFPETLAVAAKEFAPHSLAFYLRSLAGEFHSYYNAERILVEDEALRAARLALAAAVRQTLANGLRILGVGAPEKM